jgi:hypothetical protein
MGVGREGLRAGIFGPDGISSATRSLPGAARKELPMRLAPTRLIRLAFADLTPRRLAHLACAGVALSGTALLSQAADFVKPDIKPGLWEVTNNPQVSGEMPISEDQLAKMSPEQRARFEAAMKSSVASAGKPHTYKECMTPEKIARGFDMDKAEGKDCKRKIVSSTPTDLQMHDECSTADRKTISDVHFQVKSGTQMSGKINVVITSGAKTMTVNSTVQGKWLGANCGSVKDAELEK